MVWGVIVLVKEFLCFEEFGIPTAIAPPFSINILGREIRDKLRGMLSCNVDHVRTEFSIY